MAAKRKPNFPIVLIDDPGFDKPGICGHPFIRTPNIDRIGHESAMLTSALSTAERTRRGTGPKSALEP